MVKMLSNLFNKRKREIESLNKVIDGLINKNEQLEKVVRVTTAEKNLLEREKDDLINRLKDYETQIKKLNLTVGDLSRTDNNSRYY